jgi:hypothetical protein
MYTNKTFWEIVSQSFYDVEVKESWSLKNAFDLQEELSGFDLEEELNPEQKLFMRMQEAQNGIMSCSDLELIWFHQEQVQRNEKDMKPTGKQVATFWVATALLFFAILYIAS